MAERKPGPIDERLGVRLPEDYAAYACRPDPAITLRLAGRGVELFAPEDVHLCKHSSWARLQRRKGVVIGEANGDAVVLRPRPRSPGELAPTVWRWDHASGELSVEAPTFMDLVDPARIERAASALLGAGGAAAEERDDDEDDEDDEIADQRHADAAWARELSKPVCRFCGSAFAGARCGVCGRAQSEAAEEPGADEARVQALVRDLIAEGAVRFRPRYPGSCAALLADTTRRLLDESGPDDPDRARLVLDAWTELPYVDDVFLDVPGLATRLEQARL